MTRRTAFLLRYILPLFIVIFIIFSGIININITNTKRMNPIGNTSENYQRVSSEFGEDFADFIKDNSILKIYTDNEKYIVVKIKDMSFNIKNLNSIKEDINEETNKAEAKFEEIKKKVQYYYNKL